MDPEDRAYEIANRQEKCCSRCERVLPVVAFRTQKGKADGLRSRCRVCEAEVRRERRGQTAQKKREARQRAADTVKLTGLKVCSSCAASLPLSEFSVSARSLDGYGSTCSECRKTQRVRPDQEDVDRVDRWAARRGEFERLVSARLRGVVVD